MIAIIRDFKPPMCEALGLIPASGGGKGFTSFIVCRSMKASHLSGQMFSLVFLDLLIHNAFCPTVYSSYAMYQY